MPHSEYTTEEYEAVALQKEEAITSARRSGFSNVIGIDANAVLGARMDGEDEAIIGDFGYGQRNQRGDLLWCAPDGGKYNREESVGNGMDRLPIEYKDAAPNRFHSGGRNTT